MNYNRILLSLVSPQKKMQNRFYFDYKDAANLRQKAAHELIGRQWRPYDTKVVDVLISPNGNQTYHIDVVFEDGSQLTLYDFLASNNPSIASFLQKA